MNIVKVLVIYCVGDGGGGGGSHENMLHKIGVERGGGRGSKYDTSLRPISPSRTYLPVSWEELLPGKWQFCGSIPGRVPANRNLKWYLLFPSLTLNIKISCVYISIISDIYKEILSESHFKRIGLFLSIHTQIHSLLYLLILGKASI